MRRLYGAGPAAPRPATCSSSRWSATRSRRSSRSTTRSGSSSGWRAAVVLHDAVLWPLYASVAVGALSRLRARAARAVAGARARLPRHDHREGRGDLRARVGSWLGRLPGALADRHRRPVRRRRPRCSPRAGAGEPRRAPAVPLGGRRLGRPRPRRLGVGHAPQRGGREPPARRPAAVRGLGDAADPGRRVGGRRGRRRGRRRARGHPPGALAACCCWRSPSGRWRSRWRWRSIDGAGRAQGPARGVDPVPPRGLARRDSPGDFLSHFVERIDLYPTHVRGHPPALLLGLWGLDRIGLGGPGAGGGA